MGLTAGVPATAGAVSVLSLGIDRASEVALLQRFATLPGLATTAFLASDDFEHCDVLVVDPASPMLFVARRTAALRPDMILLMLGPGGTLHDGRDPTCPGLAPARLATLLGVAPAVPAAPVTHVPVTFARPPSGSPVASAPAGAPPPVSTPALAEQLRERIVSADSHAALMLHGSAVLLLDFDRKLAVPMAPSADDAATSLARVFTQLSLRPISAAEFNAGADTHQAVAVAPLLWAVAQQVEPAAALLPPLTAERVLSLRQWPDFRALAHRHDHFRLCCLLLKQASTVQEAAQLLDLDPAVVAGFFNAAYLSGYAEPGEARARPQPQPPPRRGGSTLARMWRSVRDGLQGASS